MEVMQKMEFNYAAVERGLRTLELGIDPEDVHMHISKIQKAFDNAFIKDDKVCGEISKNLLEARTSILLQAIQNCTTVGSTPVYPNLNVKAKCKLCSGIGAVPMMEVVYIPNSGLCESCKGTGIKTEDCSACNGTGKKGRDICGLCKGKGVYIFRKTKTRKVATKCPTCLGTKYVGAYKTTGKIIGATTCSVCKGLGQI